MTEEEAKTKLCCGPRIIASTSNLQTRGYTPSDDEIRSSIRCAGSLCMAWRSRTETITGYDVHGDPEPRGTTITGYCGLAGTL